MSEIQDSLKYTESHEWILINEQKKIAKVGITDHAQQELSDIIYVEMPNLGSKVNKGEEVSVIESVKAASDIYSPLNGEIITINENLSENPSLINTSPYEEGWLFELKLDLDVDQSELTDLLSAEDYKKIIN